MRGVICRAALFGACALSASRARAAPGDATRLEYARSEQASACPDRTALKAAVSKRLGYDPFFPAARQTVLVEILAQDGELRARMRLVDDNGMIVGSRELRERAQHCEELVASLALAISIALDPNAALGEAPAPAKQANSTQAISAETPPETAPEFVVQEPPQRTSQPRAEPSEASLDRNRLQLATRASFFADLGSAPALAFGWRLGLDLQRGSLRLAAEFSQQFPASKELEPQGRAITSRLAGALAPCLASDTLAGCGVLSLGGLQTQGEDIDSPVSQSKFYAALGARFEYTPLLLGKLRLLTQFDALKPLTPVSLRVTGAEVWHTPFLTFALGVGFRLRFR